MPAHVLPTLSPSPYVFVAPADLPAGLPLSTCMGIPRTVAWHVPSTTLYVIDQQALPGELRYVAIRDVDTVLAAIIDMTVRGAPAIGAAGAYALAMTATTSTAATPAALATELHAAKERIDSSRPTAVNLMWATARMRDAAEAMSAVPGMTVPTLKEKLLQEAHEICEDDVRINLALATAGSAVVPEGANILHHCNTGALATIDYGTALGVIYVCHQAGKRVHVWVDETRPRLQGSKLTAWELMRGGVPMRLIADNASGLLMRRRQIDVVLFGADRVAANGDVANKVGTYKMCVVAKENGIPTFACVPTSTIDLTVAHGDDIPIEERSATEVTTVGDTRVAPLDVPVFNPAFDVTPAKYLTGIITEEGICYPPFDVSLRKAKEAAEARIAAQRAALIASWSALAASV